MQCKLCKRMSEEDGLCRYHSDASKALRKGYVAWNEALSGIPWKEYLNRVKTAQGTGQWVAEVIAMHETGDLE